VIEKMLAHRQALASSANERERVSAEADVKVLGYELERRRAIRDLQIREYEHPFLWWPKIPADAFRLPLLGGALHGEAHRP
jgi:hypothetical protein